MFNELSNELLEGISVISTEIVNNSAEKGLFILLMFLMGVFFLIMAITYFEDAETFLGVLFLIASIYFFTISGHFFSLPTTETMYIIHIGEHVSTESLQELYSKYEIIEQNNDIWKIKEK